MSRVNSWSANQSAILKKQYPIIRHTRDLVLLIGKPYPAIKSKATMLGLKREVAHSGTSTATPEEIKYISANYLLLPLKTIAEHLSNGRTYTFVKGRMDDLGLVRPMHLIQKIKDDSRIKPGNIPSNKGKKQKDYMSKEAIERTRATRFKKGEPNHNSLYDGAITIRHDHRNRPNTKPHKYIRISKGKWKELQIYNWEKKNKKKYRHGIPSGSILACMDGDTLNCKPSNWFLMTKADNAIRNSGSLNLAEGYVAKTLVGKYSDPDLLREILKHPKLIEVKRQQLLLKRKINERTTNSKKNWSQ